MVESNAGRQLEVMLQDYFMAGSTSKASCEGLECVAELKIRFKFEWDLFNLTCDGLRVPSTLAASNEDNISLADSDVVAFQKEEFVDTVVLKGCNLDNGSNRAGEALLDY